MVTVHFKHTNTCLCRVCVWPLWIEDYYGYVMVMVWSSGWHSPVDNKSSRCNVVQEEHTNTSGVCVHVCVSVLNFNRCSVFSLGQGAWARCCGCR